MKEEANPFVVIALIGAGIGVIGGIGTMLVMPKASMMVYFIGTLIFAIGVILATIGDALTRRKEKKDKIEVVEMEE